MSTVVVSTRRSRSTGGAGATDSKNSPDTVKTTGWYLAKFLCRRVNEYTLEKLREHVSRCRGIKTRVRLSRDGWLASGSGGLFMKKLKSVYMRLENVRYMLQDSKFVNVLLCVFTLNDMPDGIRYEIVAYKLRDSNEVRAIVDRFESFGGDVVIDDDSLMSGSVLGPPPGSTLVRAAPAASPPAAVHHSIAMPGRPTNGSVAPGRWIVSGRQAGSRRYMSQSVGDLTAGDMYYVRSPPPTGSYREANGGSAVMSDTRRALSTSYDRRGWASESASVAFFSDTDTEDITNGVATAHVNGRMQNGGGGGENSVFDETDEAPVYLVYNRPAPTAAAAYEYNGYTTNGGGPRHMRYRSNFDSFSAAQAPVVRSRSMDRLHQPYAASVMSLDTRSDLFAGGVVKAKKAPYTQPPTLVNPRFKKQYVQARPVTPSTGGPVYRAASRTGAGSAYGGTRGMVYTR